MSNFPLNPTVGDEFNGYRWSGSAWEIIGINLTADYIEYYEKGQALGIATLDASGKVPSAQLNLGSYVTLAGTETLSNKTFSGSVYFDGPLDDPTYSASLSYNQTNGGGETILQSTLLLNSVGTNGDIALYANRNLNLSTVTGNFNVSSGANVILSGSGEYLNSVSTSNQIATIGDLSLYAPINSPTFTGNLTSPTISTTGGGGSAITIYDGGDLLIYSSGNSYGATVWTDGVPTGSGGGNSGMVWVSSLLNRNQRTAYDRSWDNYPSITILNHTDQGPQGEFRIHGSNGVSGGDFSVVTRSDGGYVSGSDERRKTNIEQISNALETVLALNGKKFNIINSSGELDPMRGSKKSFGLIAQEAINVVPESVTYYPESDTPNESGWASAYSIDYQSLIPLLIESIKELNEHNSVLRNRVTELEERFV